MIVDLAIKRDEEPLVEGGLRLRAIFCVDNAQAARAHRGFLPDHDKRIGNIAAIKRWTAALASSQSMATAMPHMMPPITPIPPRYAPVYQGGSTTKIVGN